MKLWEKVGLKWQILLKKFVSESCKFSLWDQKIFEVALNRGSFKDLPFISVQSISVCLFARRWSKACEYFSWKSSPSDALFENVTILKVGQTWDIDLIVFNRWSHYLIHLFLKLILSEIPERWRTGWLVIFANCHIPFGSYYCLWNKHLICIDFLFFCNE